MTRIAQHTARLVRTVATVAALALPALVAAQEGSNALALAPLPIAQVQPQYPSALADRRVEGEVVASFVVDEKGRPDMRSFTVVAATHPHFADAVRDAVARSLYAPAVAGGERVAAPVEQKFLFNIRGRVTAQRTDERLSALR